MFKISPRPQTQPCCLAARNTRELEYISLRIPVEIHNSRRGEKVHSMLREHPQEVLGLSEGDISLLWTECSLSHNLILDAIWESAGSGCAG
jgi:hypothetical protein